MRILILSSQAKNTGSTMRAEYFYKYLKLLNRDTEYIAPPFKTMPLFLDFILTLFYYFFKILNKKFDLVFIVKPYPNTVLPALFLKINGAKIIIDIDDLDYGYRTSFISIIIKIIQKILINFADFLTSHNEELIKLIREEYKKFSDKIYKLNQCVDFNIFKIKQKDKIMANKIRKQYKNRKIIFYMANLNIASYLDEILKAISLMKYKNFIFLIAGGGPLFNFYQKLAEKLKIIDKIIFLGEKKQEELIKYILASDICLVYYKNISVNKFRASMKLREYLALNKIVVANDIGEIRKFKKYIYLTKNDIKSYANSIDNILNNLDNKKIKKIFTKQFIIKNYNWKIEVKKFYSFFIKNKLLWQKKN